MMKEMHDADFERHSVIIYSHVEANFHFSALKQALYVNLRLLVKPCALSAPFPDLGCTLQFFFQLFFAWS